MNDYICHYGTKDMKWGIRNYQNYDGTLTPAGIERYRVKTKDGRKANGYSDRHQARKEWRKAVNEYTAVSADKSKNRKIQATKAVANASSILAKKNTADMVVDSGIGAAAAATAFGLSISGNPTLQAVWNTPGLKETAGAAILSSAIAVGADAFFANTFNDLRKTSMRKATELITGNGAGERDFDDNRLRSADYIRTIEKSIDDIHEATMNLRKQRIANGTMTEDHIKMIGDPKEAEALAKFAEKTNPELSEQLLKHADFINGQRKISRYVDSVEERRKNGRSDVPGIVMPDGHIEELSGNGRNNQNKTSDMTAQERWEDWVQNSDSKAARAYRKEMSDADWNGDDYKADYIRNAAKGAYNFEKATNGVFSKIDKAVDEKNRRIREMSDADFDGDDARYVVRRSKSRG